MPREKIDFDKVGELVFDFANGLLKDLQENLVKSDAMATGNLYQSINFEPLKITKTGIMFELIMDSYYKYVDQGVKGADSSEKAPLSPFKYSNKRPPVSKLKQWIRDKPINIKTSVDLTKLNKKGLPVKRRATAQEKQTIEGEVEKIAFLIAEGIRRKGLKATNFYSDVVNEERFNKFAKELSEAFKQDIIISLK